MDLKICKARKNNKYYPVIVCIVISIEGIRKRHLIGFLIGRVAVLSSRAEFSPEDINAWKKCLALAWQTATKA